MKTFLKDCYTKPKLTRNLNERDGEKFSDDEFFSAEKADAKQDVEVTPEENKMRKGTALNKILV